MTIWQVGDAAAHFSELIERARSEGPQTVAHQSDERVVVLSVEDYRALTAQKPDFIAYLMGGPKIEDFEIARDGDIGRTIDLD